MVEKVMRNFPQFFRNSGAIIRNSTQFLKSSSFAFFLLTRSDRFHRFHRFWSPISIFPTGFDRVAFAISNLQVAWVAGMCSLETLVDGTNLLDTKAMGPPGPMDVDFDELIRAHWPNRESIMQLLDINGNLFISYLASAPQAQQEKIDILQTALRDGTEPSRLSREPSMVEGAMI